MKMRRNFLLILFVLLLLGGCKKDKDVHVAKVQAETPDVTTTANAADISGTYSYASTLKSVVIAYGKDSSLSSPEKVTAEHTSDSYSVTINNLESGTTYYYHCIFDTGYGASESEQWSFTTQGGGGTIAGHAYVDLGLPSGLLWATCNVGASKPEDYGDYFAWGETEPKDYYDWSTYKWCNGSYNTLTKYNTQSNYGTVDNKTVLDPEDDAARANWGGAWRMPTREEMHELTGNCTNEWTTQNGVNGREFTGPNGNSIFLPAAGYYYCGSLNNAGSRGVYWSSSLNTGSLYFAYNLYFDSSDEIMESGNRAHGQSVRPVCPSQSVSAPTVTTSSVSNITHTTATCGGNVTSDGGAAVTARGVCWSTSQNPTVSDSHTADGSGTGSFTSSITGLTANRTYYVRAYATNSAGTSYGEQRTFTTQGGGGTQTTPTVTTSSVSNITQTTATCGGSVTSDGGATVTARGVCWSTSQNPTVSDSHTTDGGGTGNFTSSITGLTASTTYYVRAYATNSAGTSYGEQESFYTLQSISVPTVTTSQVSNITQTTATCGGNVTSDGGATVTARGVCWSTSQNPTVSDSHTTDGGGTGSFTSSITGLTANRTYYVRAYATNSAETSYGEQMSFTTDHEYVDLGLPSGLLWATCNVGADSPYDDGNYYAWGETEPKSTYNWSTYKWCNGSETTLTKYNTDSNYGTVDNKTVLDPEDDAAHVNWGGAWRIPTLDELQELVDNCTWLPAHPGCRVIGPNGNSIILQMAGYRANGDVYYRGDGFYWSSSLNNTYIGPYNGPYEAYHLDFYFSNVSSFAQTGLGWWDRASGLSVRPVCPSQK